MNVGKESAKRPSAAASPKKAATPAPVASRPLQYIAFQLIDAQGSNTQEETEADTSATRVINEASTYGVIIEDGLPAHEGQVNRKPFMDRLALAIESAADELLKPTGRLTKDCPYLAFWVNYYQNQSAAHIERAIAKYVKPEETDLASTDAAILARVREAVTVLFRCRKRSTGACLMTVCQTPQAKARPRNVWVPRCGSARGTRQCGGRTEPVVARQPTRFLHPEPYGAGLWHAGRRQHAYLRVDR